MRLSDEGRMREREMGARMRKEDESKAEMREL